MNSNQLKIAIIGGGPGGLCLARLLQEKNIPATVFELETSIEARTQGGCLDLHEESGQKAMKAAGLWEEVLKHLRYEGGDLKIIDKTGHVHYEEVTDENETRPEIDRVKLREVMLKAINPDNIKWGYSLKKVEQNAEGKYDLHFQDKVEKDFDLVVGADGAWSKVRKLLDETLPQYSGVSIVELQFKDVDNRQPEIAKLIGRGSIMAIGPEKGLLGQRNGDGSAKVYASMNVDENYLKESGVDFSNEKEGKEFLLKNFQDWDSQLKDLIVKADEMIPRPLYMLPVGYTWTTKPGLTLLGDAAHLMTPFAGEGVNLALIDAYDLAESIANAGGDRLKAVEEYQKGMWERAKEKAQETDDNKIMMFREDSPAGLTKMFTDHQPPAE